jgi:hypothetical protein
MTWIRVTRNKKCPVCDRSDWCCYTEEGYVMCMRSDGDELSWDFVRNVPTNGGVILRRNGLKHEYKQFDDSKQEVKPNNIDWKTICSAFEINENNRQGAGTWLSESLKIPLPFLEMFGLGWSEGHKSFTFPMFDHDRNIVGVRLRKLNGEKRAIRGSRDGLFLPYFDFVEPILVTEGPTDACALTSVGFATIGRPSCLGGVEIVAKMAHNKNIVIVSDKDSPGRKGAEALASRLIPIAKEIKVIEPTGSAQDARDWVNKGATHEVIQMVIEQAIDIRKKRVSV